MEDLYGDLPPAVIKSDVKSNSRNRILESIVLYESRLGKMYFKEIL